MYTHNIRTILIFFINQEKLKYSLNYEFNKNKLIYNIKNALFSLNQ